MQERKERKNEFMNLIGVVKNTGFDFEIFQNLFRKSNENDVLYNIYLRVIFKKFDLKNKK